MEEETAAPAPVDAKQALRDSIAKITAEPVDEAPAEETALDAAPEEQQPAEPAAPADPLSELKALAQKLGLTVDGTKVLSQERGAWREHKRKEHQAIEEMRRKAQEEIDGLKTPAQKEIEFAKLLKSAYDAGDYQGLAKALGHKDWNSLQEDVVAKTTDPSYTRIRDLERKLEEQEQARQAELKERETQAQQSQRQQQIEQYKQQLSRTMQSSEDPFLKTMQKFPWFVHSVFEIQRDNYSNGETISAEEAVRMVPRGGGNSIRGNLEELRGALNEALGEMAAASATAAPVPGKRPAPKTAVVEKGKASPEPAPLAPWKSRQEFIAHGAALMKAAAEADEKAERELRR